MIDATNTALILEGGGTRNAYTAPALMKLVDEGVKFGWVGGVSAGAVHAANFVAGDTQRIEENFTTFMGHPKIGGLRSLAFGSGLLNAEFLFEQSGDVLPFDWEAFESNPVPVHIEAVDANTGETRVFTREHLTSEAEVRSILRASSTIPMIMPMKYIDGNPYVDGALGDSGGIVLKAAQEAGFDKFLILATRPRDYVREPVNRPAMIRRMFPKYPGVAQRQIDRPELYNSVKAEIFDLEEQGKAYTFWPEKMTVESTELKVAKLQRCFNEGKDQLEREWEDIRAFLEG
ncbi:patatin-like phospholipase family protein [Corynebacterium aquatimens]|uniref:Patatin/cPLA2 family phospholipase n=1 Tax=Corynebacterium aquatimens TaxID=1190508 RepID=A0A931GRM6_9CORY|nr:patatin family protein [Corynebacterium aquatimens]MBG6121182.1 putative patatin/cPLA2 family phospholipase [Corynebacterium aquatimens]WJY66264.1 Patatin-like phospholipase [Corynebacterium aquatimens]